MNTSRSMKAILVAGLIAAAACQSALAQSAPEPIRKAMQEARESCKPDKASLGKGFLTTKDVNGDRVPDYVLNYEFLKCGDSSSLFCGSSGCLTQVFASRDGGFVKVLDENVQDLVFKTIKGRPAMQMGLHGTSCGRGGAEACGATLYWNGVKFSSAN